MRELTTASPLWRLLGFALLTGMIWLATSLFDPPADRLAALTAKQQAGALFDGELALPEGEDAAAIGAFERGAAWSAPCDDAGAVVAGRLAPTEGAPGRVALSCRVTEASVTLTAQITGLDAAREVVRAGPLADSTSLLPPLFGILLALVFRKVLLALFAAVVFGALLATDGALGDTVVKVADDYLARTIIDEWNLYIFGFTLLLVGMIHVCIRMGGMQGIVDHLSRIARGRRSAQAAAGAVGCAVFFDDYANTVVVGSSVRPLTDRYKISREKLAYIVDSTAAPIAGVAVISTWIGFEISVFNEQLPHLAPVATNGYDFFFQILPYRFYCLFALGLVFLVAFSGRDFGPMYKAERRALRKGLLRRPARPDAPLVARPPHDTRMKEGAPPRWLNGVLPIALVILGTFVGAIVVGTGHLDSGDTPLWAEGLGLFERLREAFIAASDDTMAILFWASAAGAGAALALALGQRILSLREAGRAFMNGLWMIAPVIAILVLAIALRKVTDDLDTDLFLVALIGDIPLWILPVTIFGLAAFIAFSTGTSWGTMGILIPVAIPLVATLAVEAPNGELILILTGASVLDGAIFGDHCSLISDTTIMSSLASGCDHVDHVRTQLPYALLAMIISGALGYTLLAWSSVEIPVFVVYAAGLLAMWAWLRLRGKDPAQP